MQVDHQGPEVSEDEQSLPGDDEYAASGGQDTPKPPFTYAQMIALAIWKGEDHQRTSPGIIEFIQQNWTYFAQNNGYRQEVKRNVKRTLRRNTQHFERMNPGTILQSSSFDGIS